VEARTSRLREVASAEVGASAPAGPPGSFEPERSLPRKRRHTQRVRLREAAGKNFLSP
jgi:hypothetical protein